MRPILEAEADVIGGEGALRLAVLQPAVVPEHEHPIEEEGVVGHGDPRLAAADGLHALQAEAADVSPRTDRAPAIAGAVRVRAVLDQGHAVATRDVGEPVHRRRIAPHVHDADRPGAGRDAALHVVGIRGEGAGVDVAERRRAAALEDRRGGREERVGRHDHLGARLHAHREVGAVERGRAAVHRERVARPRERRELLLELGDRAVALGDRVDVAVAVPDDGREVAQVDAPPALAVAARDGGRAPVDGEARRGHVSCPTAAATMSRPRPS